MEMKGFIKKIEQEFDDLPTGMLTPDSNFKEIISWSSINAVVFSTMIEFDYHVMVSADDFKQVTTLSELFELILSKQPV